jgi:hypothetical protein
MDQISGIRATTIDGLKIKARYAVERYGGAPDEQGHQLAPQRLARDTTEGLGEGLDLELTRLCVDTLEVDFGGV